jgi:hypothetical protein
MVEKLDFKNTMKEFYKPSANKVSLVNVPELQFIMIDGKGSPGDSRDYIDAINSLYPIAFNLKFISKKELGKDYTVPPLEGLWWAENMDDFYESNRENWMWTMMIMTPEWLTNKLFQEAMNNSREKKPELDQSIKNVRLEKYCEGVSAQIMHIGPYANEHPTILKLHNFIKASNGKFDGHTQKHHEIYISDPRKAKPETMKTVIRQPFKYK